ncbi:unnamed protein product [Mytilus coruscus]|uniref:Uncharacterized protein n=1 Tax=Mytilus coruscus TaxID=42192 RepID=A0A6J8CYH8_MYTCO|nr:unnamed protein product [Mytilus coruscus]
MNKKHIGTSDAETQSIYSQDKKNLKDYPQHSHFDELLNHRNLKKTYRKPRLYSIYNNIKESPVAFIYKMQLGGCFSHRPWIDSITDADWGGEVYTENIGCYNDDVFMVLGVRLGCLILLTCWLASGYHWVTCWDKAVISRKSCCCCLPCMVKSSDYNPANHWMNCCYLS